MGVFVSFAVVGKITAWYCEDVHGSSKRSLRALNIETLLVVREGFLCYLLVAGETGLEPAAYGFGDRCSTIELLPFDFTG